MLASSGAGWRTHPQRTICLGPGQRPLQGGPQAPTSLVVGLDGQDKVQALVDYRLWLSGATHDSKQVRGQLPQRALDLREGRPRAISAQSFSATTRRAGGEGSSSLMAISLGRASAPHRMGLVNKSAASSVSKFQNGDLEVLRV